ncbi:MAG: hypothetical protein HY611_09600 [Elusimicrobia bacterium]|nr:hypothetical protein [Elusimicrobiota bacterium]
MFLFKRKLAPVAQLHEQALQVEKALEALCDYLSSLKEERAGAVAAHVRQARKWTLLLEQATGTLRGAPGAGALSAADLSRLAGLFELIAGEAESALDEMRRFAVKPEEPLRELARFSLRMLQEISGAVACFRSARRTAVQPLIRARQSAARGEKAFREFRRELLNRPNAVEILKIQEIYKRFSNILDNGHQAVEILGDALVLK